ncbi:MAG TPA: RagB/SusD family nutrient uptake outer membrane protein [Chitinophagaceae bacterium]|nr:RagB/SusD family nutrient uptake outer membrane protein [Chitinophagaceae bacterium]
MRIHKLALYFVFIIFSGSVISCKKYLGAKPDKALAVPGTLQDLQALLDDFSFVEDRDLSAAVQSVDDFYIVDNDYNSLTDNEAKQLYIWGTSGLFTEFPNDWSNQYYVVNIANTVLDNINTIQRTSANGPDWDNIRGQALLLRARAFQLVAWTWAKQYDSATASGDLGIPLRLHNNFNDVSVRSTLQETYNQIIKDYKEAVQLLPVNPVHPVRASRPAAYGLLARTYLSMGDYSNCLLYSDSCLSLFNSLLDFNDLNASASYPISKFNTEVIMDNRIHLPTLFSSNRAKIDTFLYQSYSDSDLRKAIYFKAAGNAHVFKGNYSGGSTMFSGIATDEVLLMKAECLARKGFTDSAMHTLNALLMTRFKTGMFEPLSAANATGALQIVLQERRKELLMRGWRWMDIRRLNKEGFNITLKREISGSEYVLSPGALRYVFPIPDNVILLSGIKQNPE